MPRRACWIRSNPTNLTRSRAPTLDSNLIPTSNLSPNPNLHPNSKLNPHLLMDRGARAAARAISSRSRLGDAAPEARARPGVHGQVQGQVRVPSSAPSSTASSPLLPPVITTTPHPTGAAALASHRDAARRPVRHPRPPARLRLRRSLIHNQNPKPDPESKPDPAPKPEPEPWPNLQHRNSPRDRPRDRPRVGVWRVPSSRIVLALPRVRARARAQTACEPTLLQGRSPRRPRSPCRAPPTRWPCEGGPGRV